MKAPSENDRKIGEKTLCSFLSHLSSIKVTLWSLTSNPLDSPSAEPEVRNLFRQYQPFCFREMGPLLTLPPVFLPLLACSRRVECCRCRWERRRSYYSAKTYFPRRNYFHEVSYFVAGKREESLPTVFPAAGWIGGEEKALTKTSSFRIGRDTIFRSCLFAGGLLPGRMLYASQIGAERNAYDRQIDALFVRATLKNVRCTS